MRWVISFFMMFTFLESGFAFTSRDSIKIKYSLGVSPSAIMNITPAMQVSQKIEFQNKIAFELHSGYIFSHININNENTKGFRLRPQLNITVHQDGPFNFDLYTFYNYRYFTATRTFDQLRANGAYTEELRGKRTTTLSGFGLGFELGFSELNSLVKKINFGLGVGWGSINNVYSDEIFEEVQFFGFDRSGVFPMPILIFHLKLVII